MFEVFEGGSWLVPHDAEQLLIFFQVTPDMDCNYTLPIDLKLNEMLFGSKSFGNVELQSRFCLI